VSPAADRTGRTRGALLLVFLALTLAVLNFSSWLVLSRAGRALEREVGLRLVTVATSAVATATPDLLLAPGVADDAYVRGLLEDLAERHGLDDIFLVDTDGIRLFALSGEDSNAEEILLADFPAFTAAAAGAPSASAGFEVAATRALVAYAPVSDWDGTVEAVLGVTASGGFLGSLPALERTFTFVTLGGAALVVLFGAVFFGMSRRLATTESALSRNETLRSMGMMAAGVAHEIRNPLAIISGTAERLRRRYGKDSDDPLFDFIPEEVDRLNGIVESYLRFARDEPPVLEDCDLARIVGRSVRMVGEEVAARGVTVAAPAEEAPLPVRADPRRLQQVLLNLLLNAAQSVRDGGKVTVATERSGDRVRITVRDDGPGFDDRSLAHAFEPFYTTREQGSGLGLAVVKRIVEEHGGSVRLANDPGGGAIVTVELSGTDGGD
jgi:signal transduction histidine kinase